jgi:hypothetical protein
MLEVYQQTSDKSRPLNSPEHRIADWTQNTSCGSCAMIVINRWLANFIQINLTQCAATMLRRLQRFILCQGHSPLGPQIVLSVIPMIGSRQFRFAGAAQAIQPIRHAAVDGELSLWFRLLAPKASFLMRGFRAVESNGVLQRIRAIFLAATGGTLRAEPIFVSGHRQILAEWMKAPAVFAFLRWMVLGHSGNYNTLSMCQFA